MRWERHGSLRHRRHPDGADFRHQPVAGLHPRLRDHLGRPEPKNSIHSAWRWLAVVVVLALSLVALRRSSRRRPSFPYRGSGSSSWPRCATSGWRVFVPWVLLESTVRPRLPLTGALVDAGVSAWSDRRGTVAPLALRVELRPLRHHRGRVHYIRLAVRRGVDLPRGRRPGPRHHHRPGQLRVRGSAGRPPAQSHCATPSCGAVIDRDVVLRVRTLENTYWLIVDRADARGLGGLRRSPRLGAADNLMRLTAALQ